MIPVKSWSQGNADSLLYTLQQAEASGKQDSNHPKLLNDLARALFMRVPDSAQKLASRALVAAIAVNDSKQQGVAHNILGIIHLDKALYDKALEELLIAVRFFDAAKDTLLLAKVYSNIGNVYGRQQQYQRALEAYHQAIHLYKVLGNTREFIGANTNIGFTYWKMGKYDLALEHQYRSLVLATEQKVPFSVMLAHINLGATYLSNNLPDSAVVHLRIALAMSRELKNKRAEAISLHYLSEHALRKKEWHSALQFSHESLNLARELQAREEQQKSLQLLANIHTEMGHFKEALEFERRAIGLKDSLFNLENTKVLASLQALYATEKKDAEIQLLRRDGEIQRLALSRQNTLRNALLLVLLLVVVVVFVLANRYRLKQKSEKRLQEQNAEILRQQEILEQQAAQIELSNTQLHDSNIKLLDANDELQTAYQEIVRQQKILESQAADIQETNTRLHESNIELQRLNTEKNEFLGIVAHDLKNPLGSIIVNASNIQRYQQALSPDQVSSAVGRILEVGSRMRDIIEDLLDVNALETGNLHILYEQVPVSSLIQSIAENFQLAAEQKFLRLNVVIASEVAVYADKSKLREVLDNLVSNAIKYSPLGKTITLYAIERQTTVRIEVQDEGPGLTDNDKKLLFRKFTRLSAQPTAGEHSTGLGLSIVKKMVEAMQGKVWCESELGKGATFIVEFTKVELPDLNLPDLNLPDLNLPDLNLPDFELPQ